MRDHDPAIIVFDDALVNHDIVHRFQEVCEVHKPPGGHIE